MSSGQGAITRQKEIYIRGAAGKSSLIPFDYGSLEEKARKKMGRRGFDYVKTGAGREMTTDHNRSALDKVQIVPKMLRDVSSRSTEIDLLGSRIPAPFLLAPIGVLDLARKRGDLLSARAANQAEIPMIFSNQASAPMETCAAVMPKAPKWMQLYWSKSNDLVKSLIERAENSGCEALVITLDTTLLGWRLRDLNNAYLPFLEGRGIAQYTSDPVFNELLNSFKEEGQKPEIGLRTPITLYQLAKNYPGSTMRNLFSSRPLRSVRLFTAIYSQTALTWEHIQQALEWTDLPVILKGILDSEDALRAKSIGVKGLIVSNHGGRQVDGAVSSLNALRNIRQACGRDFLILMDSGIRGGQDAFKAIASGADAVCIGRPYAYALALAGQRGVEELLKNYQAELELTMALSGCRNINEVKSASVISKSNV